MCFDYPDFLCWFFMKCCCLSSAVYFYGIHYPCENLRRTTIRQILIQFVSAQITRFWCRDLFIRVAFTLECYLAQQSKLLRLGIPGLTRRKGCGGSEKKLFQTQTWRLWWVPSTLVGCMHIFVLSGCSFFLVKRQISTFLVFGVFHIQKRRQKVRSLRTRFL